MLEQLYEWRACQRCRVNRARVELQITLQRQWSIGVFDESLFVHEKFLDADVLAHEDRIIFCFACYIAEHGTEYLESFGELTAHPHDVPMESK
ncbi:hypothetical protein BH09PLA1_BH09PLA1_18390 [soil metagenome]